MAGTRQWPIFLPTNEWPQPVIFGLQAGSPLLRDGGRYGAFEEPAFRRRFDFYLGLFRDGPRARRRQHEIANPYQEFARGNFAMYITGPWNIGEFERRLPPDMQDTWTTAPLPGRRARIRRVARGRLEPRDLQAASRIRRRRGS